MALRNSLLILVVLGVFSTQMFQARAAPLDDEVFRVLASQMTNMWQTGSTEFLGNPCRYTVMPTFRRWELKFRGKFWCPGLAPFSGKSLQSSDSSAVENAIRDFARKALTMNLVTRSEVEIWL